MQIIATICLAVGAVGGFAALAWFCCGVSAQVVPVRVRKSGGRRPFR